ncbi:MAG: gliding motility-associated C-terminal domain-containing protein [Saprospiraceae bacterium]
MNNKYLWIAILLVFRMVSDSFATESAALEGPLTIAISTQNTSCAADLHGSATVTALGGKLPYVYEWSNGATTAALTNLVEGSYFVTVTDALGSKKNSVAIIKASNRLKLRFDQQSIQCAGQTDGKVVAIPEGGIAPFTYEWEDGTRKSFLEGVRGGMYEITVTDANGCRAEDWVMVVEPEELRVDAFYYHVSCGATADGLMEVTASGGTGTYTYFWALDGKGGTKRTDLAPGAYSVTVTDANGCTAMICPEIIASKTPLLSASSNPETCPGEGDGTGTVTANGDSPPYVYQWPNNESPYSTAFNLTAGTYMVTVTNFRECSATVEVVVGQAGGGFGFVVESNGMICGNAANGQANVRITGGVGPFKYEWIDENTNTVVSTEERVNNLTPGNYEVRVSDANGCFGQRDILLIEKPVPTISATTLNSRVCFGEKTGAAVATAAGGEGDFTYEWSNGQKGANANNLAGGTYQVTATDGNGCQATTSVVIIDNAPVNINEAVNKPLCHNGKSGSIIVNVSGGSGDYAYRWSNGATTEDVNNLLSGTYFLTVTDKDGCQAIKGITIDQPTLMSLEVTTTNAADLNSSDGSATLTVSGGTLPYKFAWSNGATTQNLTNIPAGSYTVTITDGNSCEETTTVVVEADCTLMATISETIPTSCAGNDGAIVVTTTGAKGGLTFKWSNGATTESLSDLVPGFYGVTITDGNNCEYIGRTFVTDACNCTQPVLEKVLVFEATCGESDGVIQIEMQGDDNAFNYQWSDNAISGTEAKDLPAGAYEVTITDKNNAFCQTTEIINIGNSNVGPITVLRTDPEICNQQKGTALLVPGTLTYTWSDGGAGGYRADLSAGKYLVTVSIPGLEGCMDILSIDIGLESGLKLATTIDQHPDCGQSNGIATINVAGGSGDYSYSWGAATHHNLPSGTYDITVTDKVTNCTESILFTLLNEVPTANITLDTISNVSCAGRTDGFIRYQMTPSADFVGPASIIITDGKGKEFTQNALPVGNYCLIAKDANACLAGEVCFEITEPDFLFVDVTVIPKTCSVDNTILLTTNGGNGQYTYDWADQDGKINPRDRRMIENGAYSVTVSDEAGCSLAIDSIMVDGECFICALEVTAAIDVVPECNLPIGAVTINTSNVLGNLTYSWGEDSIRTNLSAGDYTVTVTDDFRGCQETVSFTVPELKIPQEVIITELIVCPNETGKLKYDVDNFRCFKQPIQVTITDEQGTIYDENALPAFGEYIFVTADGDGVEISRQAFSVEGYAPIITNSKVADEGCTVLGAIDLDLIASESNYSIQWEDLTGENQTADRTALSEGNYSVTITDNTTGCSVTNYFVVHKNTGIAAELAPTALTCDNAPVQVFLEGDGLVEYKWSPAELVMTGQGTASPTLFPSATNPNVSVTATNAFGCTITKDVEVVSIQTNLPGGIGITPQCDGLTVGFSSEGVVSDYYIWDFGDGTTSSEVNPTHIYQEAGDYAVSLHLSPDVPCAEEKGILASSPLNLVADAKTAADFEVIYDPCVDEGVIRFKDNSTATPGTIATWDWDFGNGMTSSKQNPIITLAEGTELDVTLKINSNIGCDGAAVKSHSFKVIRQPKIPLAHLICQDVPTELNPNAITEGISYKWSPAELLDNPTAANPIATIPKSSDLMVKITQDGCVKEEVVKIEVPREQEFELSEDEEVCDTTSRLIYVEAPGNSRIEWTDVATGKIIGGISELMVAPGIYQVKLTDENNCTVTEEVAIENYEIVASIIDNTDPCEGGVGILEVANEGIEAITEYQWEDAEGIISANLNQDNIEIEPAVTTDYTVTVRNDFGCEATLTENVAVANLVDMVVIPERDTIFKGELTPINIVPAGAYIIEWAPSPTLSSMSGFEQVATPEETTTYTVTIIDEATNCSITREVTIFVKSVVCGTPNIFFPNAFSPNGDGNNDVLYVRGNAISDVYFAIYNRWGEQVFESNSKDIGWDGTFNGQVVSSDVYGYYLKVTCVDGEVFETQGNVTVLN